MAQLTIAQLRATATAQQEEEKSEQSLESLPPIFKEQVDHLTLLRDNLEASLLQKEDLIAELRLQLDEVVADSEECKRHMEASLNETRRNREEVEGRVLSLVARYEALMKQHNHERESQREELIKKDIEIELLNGSLSNLNSKVSEYEETLSSLQVEVSERGSKISQLEATIGDLSEAQRERDEKEQQLSVRFKEISKLEESLVEVEGERRGLLSNLEVEKARVEELRARVHQMEMEVKEKEVLQQFLEKEIVAREEEVSQSNTRIQELEGELETVRCVAIDLQEEAESKLNQMLTLQATVSAKDYDLEAKSDLITSLQQEMNQKANETMSLQERFEVQMNMASKIEDDLLAKKNQVEALEDELITLKMNLRAKEECLSDAEERAAHLEENNNHLEQKLVELMTKTGDREAQYVARMNGLEGELDEMGVKYSEALLEHEATRRVLTQASEELEKESLVRLAAERELCSVKDELHQCLEEKVTADTHLKDLVRKYTNLEDALACEEAENRDLEERLEEARSAAATTHNELTTAHVAIEGFKTQIIQLKIDMHKKCDAVEEMQQCIETLREEKQHLTSLRDNLEDTVDLLRHQAAATEREAEDERMTFRSRISDLENHLKEAEEQVEKEMVKVVSAKEELCRLEEREREEVGRVAQLTARVEELEADCDGYKDQLKNLETSLQDKTMELEAQRQEMKATTALQTTANTLRQEVEALNTTLTTKTTQLDTLTTSLSTKDQELQALKKVADEREGDLQTIAKLREDLEATTEALTRLEEEKEDTAALRQEMEDWKAKFLHLERMIEPFRAQLDAYEVEKNGLLEQSSAAKDEVDKLSRQYATLLGHQNQKQKIHHVRQLKIDNNALKEEVHKLRQEVERNRKTVRRMEEKLLKASFGGSTNSLASTTKLADTSTTKLADTSARLCVGDKENSSKLSATATSFFEPTPSLASTPLKPSNGHKSSNRTHHRL